MWRDAVFTLVWIIGMPIYARLGMKYYPGEMGFWMLTVFIWPFGLLLVGAMAALVALWKIGIYLAAVLV